MSTRLQLHLIFSIVFCILASMGMLAAADRINSNKAAYEISKVAAVSSLTPGIGYENVVSPDDELGVRWSLPISGATIKRIVVPAQEAGVKYLLIETEQHDLIAVNRDNGQPIWWVKLTDKIFGDIFVGGYSVMFVSNGRIIRLEKMSGDILWNIDLPFAPAAGPVAIDTSEKDVMVFIPGLNRITYAFDVQAELWPPKTGESGLKRADFQVNINHLRLLWRYQTDAIIKSSYLLYNDRLFSGSWTNEVYGISLAGAAQYGSPEDVWEYRTNRGCWATPVGESAYVLFSALDSTVYCLDANTGMKVWRYIATDALYTSVQLLKDLDSDETIVVQKVGKNGDLIGLDFAKGKLKWGHKKGRKIAGVLENDNPEPKLRRVAVSFDEDNYLTALLPFAEDKRSEEQKAKDYAADIILPAKKLWRVKVSHIADFARNNDYPIFFAVSADKKAVIALEEK